MNRYEKGKIYKLVNSVDDEIYVGSTCLDLPKRLYKHKKLAKDKPDRHVYKHLIDIGWEHVRIIQIEEYKCKNKNELLAREQHYIDTLKPSLNKINSIYRLCEHQRRKDRCVECDGISICKHKRRKSDCVECDGGSICEHKRRKSRCVECGGSSICEHHREKNTCKDCGGSSVCEHKRQKSSCKDCNNFKCDTCEIKLSGKSSLNRHYTSKKHIEKLNEKNNV